MILTEQGKARIALFPTRICINILRIYIVFPTFRLSTQSSLAFPVVFYGRGLYLRALGSYKTQCNAKGKEFWRRYRMKHGRGIRKVIWREG